MGVVVTIRAHRESDPAVVVFDLTGTSIDKERCATTSTRRAPDRKIGNEIAETLRLMLAGMEDRGDCDRAPMPESN